MFSFSSTFLSLSLLFEKNSPCVAEGRGPDQEVGPRARDEAQGVVPRLGVPVFRFSFFSEGKKKREKEKKKEVESSEGKKKSRPRLLKKSKISK